MTRPPLQGIRVIELCLGIAGPHTAHILAMFGADVIKVESSRRPDYFRGDEPEKWERRAPFAQVNLNKKGLVLDLKNPRGVEVIKRLVKISDAVVENFSLGVLERLGLGYDSLVKIKPDIIMLSMQGLGTYGPKSKYVTWAGNILAMIGEDYLWNHSYVQEPISAGLGHPDWFNGIMGCLALTTAIYYHTQTGKGQFIEAAQAEMTASRLGPAYLEFGMNGRDCKPAGNRSKFAAPHNCYPCKGKDRWCAIAVFSDAEWQRLCQAMGNPEWAKDCRFSTLLGRLGNVDELDKRIGEWTVQYEPSELVQVLQEAGVRAGAVQNGDNLLNDAHLKERGFVVELDHAVLGRLSYAGLPMKLSATPGNIHSSAPLLGEHTDYVCKELLAMSQGEVEALVEEGVLV